MGRQIEGEDGVRQFHQSITISVPLLLLETLGKSFIRLKILCDGIRFYYYEMTFQKDHFVTHQIQMFVGNIVIVNHAIEQELAYNVKDGMQLIHINPTIFPSEICKIASNNILTVASSFFAIILRPFLSFKIQTHVLK